jgi:4,5-DOPA dioxygenase extradiol
MSETSVDAMRGDGTRMPVLFVGHGSPMNQIEDNRWSRGFAGLAAAVGAKPRAILAVSAHWYVDGTWLTANERPPTIHDFSGFPEALYAIDYPAQGEPQLAARARSLIGIGSAGLSEEWGLDHGSWSVLRWMYPDADVPVVQLSIDRRIAPAGHLAIGRALAPLRDEGVLIVASGNVTHNLRDAFSQMRAGSATTPDWARRFDRSVAEALVAHDLAALTAMWPDSDDGRRSHPTPDHWLPMLYACGASAPDDQVGFPVEGFDLGSLSMRCAVFFGS